MKIEPKHFKGVGENLIANKLDPRLMKLLESELDSGTLIMGASRGWPSKNGVMVQLQSKMNLSHELEGGVSYKHINAPHYWIHQYTTLDGDNYNSYDLLICGN